MVILVSIQTKGDPIWNCFFYCDLIWSCDTRPLVMESIPKCLDCLILGHVNISWPRPKTQCYEKDPQKSRLSHPWPCEYSHDQGSQRLWVFWIFLWQEVRSLGFLWTFLTKAFPWPHLFIYLFFTSLLCYSLVLLLLLCSLASLLSKFATPLFWEYFS